MRLAAERREIQQQNKKKTIDKRKKNPKIKSGKCNKKNRPQTISKDGNKNPKKRRY